MPQAPVISRGWTYRPTGGPWFACPRRGQPCLGRHRPHCCRCRPHSARRRSDPSRSRPPHAVAYTISPDFAGRSSSLRLNRYPLLRSFQKPHTHVHPELPPDRVARDCFDLPVSYGSPTDDCTCMTSDRPVFRAVLAPARQADHAVIADDTTSSLS
jgi:hypothetical protein